MRRLRGQLLAAVMGCAGLSGCASMGPPLPPSLELPRAPSDLRAERKGDRVTLTWTIPAQTTDRRGLRYLGKTNICRSLEAAPTECGKPVDEVAPPAGFAGARKSAAQKVKSSFVDTLPSALEEENPAGMVTYAVEVLNTARRAAGLSNRVRVPRLPALAPFSGFSAQVMAQGVMMSWRCNAPSGKDGSATKYLLRIYRHAEGTAGETRIAEIDVTSCAMGKNEPTATGQNSNPAAEYLDQSFEWEKTYFYRGAVTSMLEMAGKPALEVEGDDTPAVKVFAHDIFPPAVPTGVQAVYSGPGQQPFIDLIWAPVADADLEGYNVYRREDGAKVAMLNSELVKSPAFRDKQVEAGKTYSYSVSAVDVRGNESARSEEGSERVP